MPSANANLPINQAHFRKKYSHALSTALEIDAAVQALALHPMVSAILEATNISMVVVNSRLHIVAANHVIAADLGDSQTVIGKRIGEVIRCVNTTSGETGCATCAACDHCGATQCVVQSFETGQTTRGECLIESTKDGFVHICEYSVKATPIQIGNATFAVVAMQDISDSKRRSALERIFFHDLNNTLTGLIGWSEDLVENSSESARQSAEHIELLARRLVREVTYQRTLVEVEAGAFAPVLRTILPIEVFENIQGVFARHEATSHRTIEIDQPISQLPVETDSFLVERVLINMVKNALEETPVGGIVRLGCTEEGNTLRFYVWNAGEIPRPIQPHIFKRSFSTKSDLGRGLGTYSMKLFGERVLGGRVWFDTGAAGTHFCLALPTA